MDPQHFRQSLLAKASHVAKPDMSGAGKSTCPVEMGEGSEWSLNSDPF